MRKAGLIAIIAAVECIRDEELKLLIKCEKEYGYTDWTTVIQRARWQTADKILTQIKKI